MSLILTIAGIVVGLAVLLLLVVFVLGLCAAASMNGISQDEASVWGETGKPVLENTPETTEDAA